MRQAAILHALHYDECHEGVTRKGEFQPCDKPAVALARDRTENDRPYPVCAYHAHGDMVTLTDLRAALNLDRSTT